MMKVLDKIKAFFKRPKPEAKGEEKAVEPPEKEAVEAPEKKTGESGQQGEPVRARIKKATVKRKRARRM